MKRIEFTWKEKKEQIFVLSSEGAQREWLKTETPIGSKPKLSNMETKTDPKDPKHNNPSLSLNNDTNQKKY